MPDNTLTAEQIDIKVILRRWDEFRTIRALFAVPIQMIIALGLYYVFMSGSSLNSQFVVFIISLGITTFSISQFILQIITKRFIKQMTIMEEELIISAPDTHLTSGERASLKHLQTAYTKVNPKRELLRASTEPQDDILLRAAHTDNTPLEELLRPDNSDNHNP